LEIQGWERWGGNKESSESIVVGVGGEWGDLGKVTKGSLEPRKRGYPVIMKLGGGDPGRIGENKARGVKKKKNEKARWDVKKGFRKKEQKGEGGGIQKTGQKKKKNRGRKSIVWRRGKRET